MLKSDHNPFDLLNFFDWKKERGEFFRLAGCNFCDKNERENFFLVLRTKTDREMGLKTFTIPCYERWMSIPSRENFLVSSPLLDPSQLIIYDVVVERIFSAVCSFVLFLQLCSQLCFVNVFRSCFRCRGEA